MSASTGAPPQIHILLGPVAAGKSTYGRRLATAQRLPLLVLDKWMTRLYGDDERPAEGRIEWYLERRSRCLQTMLSVCRDLLDLGVGVVLEPSLIRADSRRILFETIAAWPCDVVVHAIDAPLSVRRARILERNEGEGETFAMTVPMDVFERASAMWEPLGEEECRGWDIRWVGSAEPAPE